MQLFRHHSEYTKNAICEKCGCVARRIISLPSAGVGENVRHSYAMGVNPNQIEKAKKLFPGSEYTPDGRLVVKNRKDKLKKMKQRNMVEWE